MRSKSTKKKRKDNCHYTAFSRACICLRRTACRSSPSIFMNQLCAATAILLIQRLSAARWHFVHRFFPIPEVSISEATSVSKVRTRH